MNPIPRPKPSAPAQFFKAWLPVIIWCSCMFSASTNLMSAAQTSRFVEPFLRWLIPGISEGSVGQIHFIVRKCAHLTEYAILAGLLRHAIMNSHRNPTGQVYWKITLLALVLATVFAASDEFHQSFVPSREASVIDVLIDMCGAAIGLAFLVAIDSLKIKFRGRVGESLP